MNFLAENIDSIPDTELQTLLQLPMATGEQIDRMLHIFEELLYSSYVGKLPPEQLDATLLLAALEQIYMYADGIGHKRAIAYYKRHLITLQPTLSNEERIQRTAEYCAASRNVGDPLELAEAYRQLGTLYRNTDFELAKEYFDKSLEYAYQSGSVLSRCYSIGKQATLLKNQKRLPEAIELLEQALQHPDNTPYVSLFYRNDLSLWLLINNQLEKAFFVLKQILDDIYTFSNSHNAPEGEYIFPQEYTSLGKVISETGNANKIVSYVFTNLATVYTEIGALEKAAEYHYAGFSLAKKIGNHDLAYMQLLNIASLQRDLGNTQVAIDDYINVLEYCRQNNRLPNLGVKAACGAAELILADLGVMRSPYTVEQLLEIAEESTSLSRDSKEYNEDITFILILQARWARQQNNHNNAYEIAVRAMQQAEQITHRHYVVLAQAEKIRAEFNLHQYEECIANFRALYADVSQEALLIKKDVYLLLQEITPVIKQYNLLSDAELLQYANDYIELQKALYEEQSQKEIRKLQILHQVEDYRFRLEQERQSKEHAQELLEQKRKELLTLAMTLIQKNEFLQHLQKRLSEVHGSGAVLREQLTSISQEIATTISADKQWEIFEKQFTTLNEKFINTLIKRYPTLTKQESKIAALLRTGLSTKDISRLFLSEVRTVENHRTNIRKKIGLSTKQDLVLFLQTI